MHREHPHSSPLPGGVCFPESRRRGLQARCALGLYRMRFINARVRCARNRLRFWGSWVWADSAKPKKGKLVAQWT